MPAEAIARIQAVLDAEVARGAVAGGVALMAHGDAVDTATAGVRSLDCGAPMRRDDIFHIMR